MHYKDKTVLQVYLTNDLLSSLKKYAAEDNRSVSNFVNVILQSYVTERNNKGENKHEHNN